MLVADFETEAIVGNPVARPPVPVGLAVKKQGKKPVYLHWGHHDSVDGSTQRQKAVAVLAEAKANKEPILFHNAKFDVAVAAAHLGVDFDTGYDPLLIHDTMFQIFLKEPYANTFSLKPSSERILGIAPEEQDALRDWILAHVAGSTPKNFGAYIARAPASVVAPYAIGDITRTLALHNFLIDKIPHAAYEREQRLRPILMESERRGVCVDQESLENDVATYEKTLVYCDEAIRRALKAPNCDLSKPQQMADALESAGLIGQWVLTPTGKRSVSRDNLEKAIADKPFLNLLQYRNALEHCMGNFGRPWVELTRDYGGRMHPEWNQVRQMKAEGGKETKGARTGRVSCSKPNFTNMPNEYELDIPDGLPPLPLMRKYLKADKGYVWCKRDYSQQELRILAHFSEGRLYERYQADPTIDAHEETSGLITEHTGLALPRKHVKITGFSVIYGAGLGSLAEQMGVPYEEAQRVRNAYFKALPEVPRLMKECAGRGKGGGTIVTWGGREYPVEPPKIIKGRWMDYSYKLLNYLIQGSAADCTKEALIRWNQNKGAGQLLCSVYDENDIQVPKHGWKIGMGFMKEAMESIEFDVKMLSDGFVGDNWANLKGCK